MLFRNLISEGLCNGIRMVVLNVRRKILQCGVISRDRQFRERIVMIPRIRLISNTKTLPA